MKNPSLHFAKRLEWREITTNEEINSWFLYSYFHSMNTPWQSSPCTRQHSPRWNSQPRGRGHLVEKESLILRREGKPLSKNQSVLHFAMGNFQQTKSYRSMLLSGSGETERCRIVSSITVIHSALDSEVLPNIGACSPWAIDTSAFCDCTRETPQKRMTMATHWGPATMIFGRLSRIITAHASSSTL